MGAVAVIELELGRRHHRSPSATLTRQHPTADHRRCRPSSLAGTAATDALTPAFASGPSLRVRRYRYAALRRSVDCCMSRKK